ncbi:MAG TPA: ribosome maturation factor RimM, partial [Rickettsia endosymbiont of Sericostoma sp. HW-2014]|nr:ribosome maturation factor RimM [Rickettsia endosymbiont of Sericostoma sp. HW-2014]
NVIVKSFTMPNTNIIKMNLVDELGEKIILKLLSQNSKGDIICRFNQVNNRTSAEELKGCKIFCHRSDFPTLSEGEFYIEDLRGLLVLDSNLVVIGKITNIFNFNAGDIIEIEFVNNKTLELFPFNKQFFPVITKEHAILTKFESS